MSKFNFYLRDNNAIAETPIQLFISYNNIRIKYPTSKRINPKYWNKVNQSARSIKEFPQAKLLNATLRSIRETAESVLLKLELELERPPTKVELINGLNRALKFNVEENQGVVKKGFIESMDELIKESVSGRRLDDSGKRLNKRTISMYLTTQKRLLEFNQMYPITFENIDQNFYSQFLSFLNDKGYTPNTVGKHIQILKTFLSYATEKRYNSNLYFKSRKFKAFKEPGFSIYLNIDELNSLKDIDLSKEPHLERVRDLFLVGCWTGLRFSDFTSIKKENIDDKLLKIKTFKTGERVVIPILPTVRDILDKYEGVYDGPLPPAISNQKMNSYLKQIAKRSELLNAPIRQEKIKGGKKIEESYMKWELVTTHTARRSFATNMYKSGFPTLSIMKITGHQTESAFLLYIKVTSEENATRLLEHWENIILNNVNH